MAENLNDVWNPLHVQRDEIPNIYLSKPNLLTDHTKDRQLRLDELVRLTRHDNFKYLNDHLEIRGILRAIFQEITTEFPSEEELPQFFCQFFGQCKTKLQTIIREHVEYFKEQRRKKRFPDEDEKSSDTSCGLFSSSSGDDGPQSDLSDVNDDSSEFDLKVKQRKKREKITYARKSNIPNVPVFKKVPSDVSASDLSFL